MPSCQSRTTPPSPSTCQRSIGCRCRRQPHDIAARQFPVGIDCADGVSLLRRIISQSIQFGTQNPGRRRRAGAFRVRHQPGAREAPPRAKSPSPRTRTSTPVALARRWHCLPAGCRSPRPQAMPPTQQHGRKGRAEDCIYSPPWYCVRKFRHSGHRAARRRSAPIHPREQVRRSVAIQVGPGRTQVSVAVIALPGPSSEERASRSS